MKPPTHIPKTASRKQTRKSGRRSNSGRKRPKRLVNRENKEVGQYSGASVFSPEALAHKKVLRGKPSSSPLSVLTPPSFNISCGSEIYNDVVSYLEKIEGDGATCSTPFTPKNHLKSPISNTSALLFELSSSCDPKDNHIECTPLLPRSKSASSFLTTPVKDTENNLLLSNWGIPEKVLEQYAKRGISSMFHWQAECLMMPNVLNGGNFVYSAPTSAGKTLVAELLALKCVLELKKKVIMILPFVSIAHEKSNYLQQIWEPVGVKVGGFMGSQAPSGGFAAIDIAICTIEKANSLVNRLLEENTTHQLGVVIIDELHMIGDPHRGYLLELLLTKLMFVSNLAQPLPAQEQQHHNGCRMQMSIQLIGMSATLPNLDMLAGWLKAELYHTDFRPVPLKEMVKIGSTLYNTDLKKITEYDQSGSLPGDEGDVLLLCRERVAQGHSVLIFCPTKAWCENLSTTLAGALARLISCDDDRGSPSLHLDTAALLGVCEQLRRTEVGLDRVLEQTIPYGVAFHHAGLTMGEREIIEGSFRQFHIKILVATSTLSSGVNLPARLVIIRTPFFQRALLDVLVYKQMVGRAGRKGVDDSGESILICKENERSKVVSLFKSTPKPVQSCLGLSGKDGGKVNNQSAIRRAILEVIASDTATKTHEIETYISCTLLFAELQSKPSNSSKSPSTKESAALASQSLLKSTMEFLLANEFMAIRHKPLDGVKIEGQQELEPTDSINLEYYATQLGTATVASALSPDEALVVFSELRKARKNFVLENELHIIYLVTPVYIQNQWPNIDWYKYLNILERLPSDMRHVGDTLGVKESFLAKAIQGRIPERTAAQKESLRIHRRFFTALALHDLVHEVPLIHVARRYGATKGLLQTLQSAAGTFAGMVTVFCNRLGWKNLELLLSQFQSRLLFGVERELCDLVKISLLNGFRARVLYNAGFHTIAAVATANPIAIETCLRNAVPFKSHKQGNMTEEGQSNARTTWCAKLRRGLNESVAARMIVHEAQTILSEELNVPIGTWNTAKPPTATDSDIPSGPLRQNGQPSNSLAGGMAVLRGHRKSPNIGSCRDELAVKKHCLEAKTVTSEPIQEVDHKSIQDDNAPSTNVESKSLPQSPRPNTDAPEQDFIPASNLLQAHQQDTGCVNQEEANTRAKTEHTFSITGCSFLDFSPIQPCAIEDTKSVAPSPQLQSAIDNPPGPVPEVIAGDQNVIEISPNVSMTIPDSLPCSMSMSFSFNTYAMIDAACDAQLSSQPSTGKTDNLKSELRNGEVVSESVDPRILDTQGNQSVDLFQDQSHLEMENDGSKTPASSRSKLHTAAIPETPSSALSLSQANLLKELSSLCSSQLSQSGITIIDVTSNSVLFETFVSECVEQKALSFAVATTNIDQGNGIGSTILKSKEVTGIKLPFLNEQVVGVAFCWGDLDSYYISLCQRESSISLKHRIKAIQKIFTKNPNRDKVIAYDIKKHTKLLALSCDVMLMGKTLDPTVANWMLNPDAKEKTIHRMVMQYLPDQPMFSEDEDCDDMPLSSLATHSPDPQMRASAEALLAFLLASKIETLIEREELYNPLIELEMPSLLILAKMELNGIGFSHDECNNQKEILNSRISELERSAYTLAKHTFSLTSPEDVAQVLFVELKLPSGSESSNKQLKTLGANTRRGTKRRVQHLSTAKDVLEKIKSLHPLPGIILEWRRISSTMTKMVYPLFKEAVSHEDFGSYRIHPCVQFHTATGRVSVSDPNLQMVPKEYNIGSGAVKLEDGTHTLVSESQYMYESHLSTDSRQPSVSSSVCMRNVFVPFPGGVFLAADYSQLELRILAHMSGDVKLKRYLNSEGDVFKMIAGEWLGVPPSEISDKQRQEAKQVCYGMLYGIGSKALGEQLDISQEDASQFIETFKSKYPIMKKFLSQTVQDCKDKGYVHTMLGRKRFLPGIHSTNVHARSQAERQAVNTTIQGSAADLVKTAMVNIDRRLLAMFPNSAVSLTQHNSPVLHSASKLSGAYLVLQLHDELLYEVAEENLKEVTVIVKEEMENALNMTVKFPVKMKVGYSWGTLQSYSI